MGIAYDEGGNILKLYKLDLPRPESNSHILDDIRKAFNDFITEGVYTVLDATLSEKLRQDGVEPVYSTVTDSLGEWTKIFVSINGRQPTYILTLPNMDNLGRVVFRNHSPKALVNTMTSIEDLTYGVKEKTLYIAFGKYTIKVLCDSKENNITVVGRLKNKMSIHRLISLLANKEGRVIDVSEEIRNPLFRKVLARDCVPSDLMLGELLESESRGKDSLLDNLYDNKDFTLKYARDSLNQAVQIDRAIDMTLSRPVLTYPAGTVVTPALIEELKRNRINQLYVEWLPINGSSKLVSDLDGSPLLFTSLSSGVIIPEKFIGNKVPVDAVDNKGVLTRALTGIMPPLDLTGGIADEENLRFLKSLGFRGVMMGTSAIPVDYYFELEIIGNYTARYRELVDDWSKYTANGDNWVCYKDNPNLDYEYARDKLSSLDLLALYSTLGYMKLKNVNFFMDKDTDFLKRVNLADVSLARALSKVMDTHCRTYKEHLRDWVRCKVSGETPIFIGVDKAWWKQLTKDDNLLNAVDSTNYIAELSQVIHVTYKSDNAAESMRHIPNLYYGRVCPYETPEGQKLGLVNSKAVGCVIEDGMMYARFRPVIKNSDGTVSIGSNIVKLSVKDESLYRIGDILQLKPVADNKFENTRIIAKVPNPNVEGERVIFAEVYARDLDYVFAHPEQYMSPVASMIPAASADDAVRVSFGSKMIKSAIYLLHPDKPRVRTSMYSEVLNNSDAYFLRAEKDGQVTSIGNNSLYVLYDGEKDERKYDVHEVFVTTESVVFMRYRVTPGSRFKKGDILYDTSFSEDGIYRPGRNVLVAYMPSGYNYEDAVHVSERTTIDFMSIGSRTCKTKETRPSDTLDKSNFNHYLKAGSLIGTITSADGKYQRKFHTKMHSGIWYKYRVVKREYQCSLMDYNKLRKGDKLSGLHGNKGVNALVSKDSEMPMLANGTSIQLLANPHGVPSRMNIGQILEGHLGFIGLVLDVDILDDSFNGATTEDVKKLMKYAYDLSNADSMESYIQIARSFPDVPEVFVNHLIKSYNHVQSWKGTFDENGDARLYNPVTMEWFPFKVTLAVSTFMKLKQEADTKIHERAGIAEEDYIESTRQPTKGGNKGGGQAMGEMELCGIAAYGASQVLNEMCNIKSDNVVAKTNMELDAMGEARHITIGNDCPRSVENLIYYLEGMGLALDGDELPDVSLRKSLRRYTFDVQKILSSSVTESEESPGDDTYERILNDW